MLNFCANLSMLFNEVKFIDKFKLASEKIKNLKLILIGYGPEYKNILNLYKFKILAVVRNEKEILPKILILEIKLAKTNK